MELHNGEGGGGTVGPGTTNEIAYFDTPTSIASLSVATYPSLTELSYVKGATSSIQNQLNAITSATLSAKGACDVATTAAGTLASSFAAGQVIDGYTLVLGDRILIKNQVAGADNGIYDITAGTPTRSTDYDTSGEVQAGTYTNIINGTANANTIWQQTTVNPTLGVSSLVFVQVTSLNSKLAAFGATFDGQGGVITSNNYTEVLIPYSGNVTSWKIHSITPSTGADLSGSIIVDIKRSGTSIIGSGNKPTLTSAANASQAANASWTSKVVTAGDTLAFYVSGSPTTCVKVLVEINITKT